MDGKEVKIEKFKVYSCGEDDECLKPMEVDHKWDAKKSMQAKVSELIDSISKKVHREFKADVIKFNENKSILMLVIILLCIEWVVRRKKGLS